MANNFPYVPLLIILTGHENISCKITEKYYII